MVKFIDFNVFQNDLLEIILSDYSTGDSLYINKMQGDISIHTDDGIELISFSSEDDFREFTSYSYEDFCSFDLKLGEVITENVSTFKKEIRPLERTA